MYICAYIYVIKRAQEATRGMRIEVLEEDTGDVKAATMQMDRSLRVLHLSLPGEQRRYKMQELCSFFSIQDIPRNASLKAFEGLKGLLRLQFNSFLSLYSYAARVLKGLRGFFKGHPQGDDRDLSGSRVHQPSCLLKAYHGLEDSTHTAY